MEANKQLLESNSRIYARPTCHDDLRQCLTLLPEWINLDSDIEQQLPAIWKKLLHQPGFHSDVLIDTDRPSDRQIVGLGMSIAMDKYWQQKFRQEPPVFAANHLYRALIDGAYEMPDDAALGKLNAYGEVAILIIHYTQLNADMSTAEAVNQIKIAGDMFQQTHSGFRLRELFVEGMGDELHYLASMGFKVRTKRNMSLTTPDVHPELPELCAFSSADAAKQLPGTPARNLFQFTPPVFGFSASERRLLRLVTAANLSDKSIAEEFSLSPNTIKKLWASVHDRVLAIKPDFFGTGVTSHELKGTTSRGPEKRKILLAYLVQHIEELRPYSP